MEIVKLLTKDEILALPSGRKEYFAKWKKVGMTTIRQYPIKIGVYFLVNDAGEITYVGASKSVFDRYHSHYCKKIIPMVDCRYIELSCKSEAEYYEAMYIHEFKPPYNKDYPNIDKCRKVFDDHKKQVKRDGERLVNTIAKKYSGIDLTADNMLLVVKESQDALIEYNKKHLDGGMIQLTGGRDLKKKILTTIGYDESLVDAFLTGFDYGLAFIRRA